MDGFLNTSASFLADLSLVLTLFLGAVALYGGLQARRRAFSKHCPVMAGAALANWIPVLMIMVPTWLDLAQQEQILAAGLASLTPFIHGLLGGFTQILMTYTVVRMYWLQQLPPRQPIWLMRITIALWVLTLIGGSAVYLTKYVN